ncbi:hypothetical protein SAMN05421784_11155 [Xenorhabdus koppenhoeferi]|uniref:Uncharacterized protein n=1 Tax=Xenorhabdus koppenhoeferi TaxID=351659 RepID=A0A1I7H4H4_9GAMM|nr:hypothetical protein SAMN05421784_11155 [Xenorhabdus koppenhoeferi]
MDPIFLPVAEETAFTVQVTGLSEYPNPAAGEALPLREETVSVCSAATITEAVQKLKVIHLLGDWPVRETGQPDTLPNFIPQTVMMYDRQGRKVLGGYCDSDIVWAQPVTLASERLSLEKQRQRLCNNAVFEQGWENYRTACVLWQKAHRLSLHLVSSRYQQCCEVADILRHSASVTA